MCESAGCLSGCGTCSSIIHDVVASPLVQFCSWRCYTDCAAGPGFASPTLGHFCRTVCSWMCMCSCWLPDLLRHLLKHHTMLLEAQLCSFAAGSVVLTAHWLRMFTRRRSRRAPATWRLALPHTLCSARASAARRLHHRPPAWAASAAAASAPLEPQVRVSQHALSRGVFASKHALQEHSLVRCCAHSTLLGRRAAVIPIPPGGQALPRGSPRARLKVDTRSESLP